MKQSKRGISLIVLVITIIVIIILAAAVILTINNNNPMDNANQARYTSDRGNVQDALTAAIGKIMANTSSAPMIEYQGDISSGIVYTLNGAVNGSKGGIIGWDSPAADAPAGYDTSVILGMKMPVYTTDTIWAIENGQVRVTVGNQRYSQEGKKEMRVLVAQNHKYGEGDLVESDNIRSWQKAYSHIDYNPNLSVDEMIKNYDVIIFVADIWSNIDKSDIINALFDAGKTVITVANDNTNQIKIIKTSKVATLNAEAEPVTKVLNNWLTSDMPAMTSQYQDQVVLIEEPNEKATVLYDFLFEGTRYPGMLYMENEKGGKWLHSQVFPYDEDTFSLAIRKL